MKTKRSKDAGIAGEGDLIGNNLSEKAEVQRRIRLARRYKFSWKVIIMILLIFLLIFIMVTYLNG